jgi:hypothetical protein
MARAVNADGSSEREATIRPPLPANAPHRFPMLSLGERQTPHVIVQDGLALIGPSHGVGFV